MRTRVGVIFGSVGTHSFRMVVTDPTISRMDYVEFDHDPQGTLLGQIVDLIRESALTPEEALGGSRTESERERIVAKVKILGTRDSRGVLQGLGTPPKAATPVFRASEERIARVFGFQGSEGAFLGFIKGYSLPVHLDLNALVQKHVSVLAKTGSGKSYAVGVLMEELLKKEVPIVVVDPHGEHSSLARPNTAREDALALRRFGVRPRGYADRVIEYSPDVRSNPSAVPLTLDGVNLPAREIAEILGPKITQAQVGLLHGVLRSLEESKREYTLEDVLEHVRREPATSKWGLVTALEYLLSLGIFRERGTPVESLVKKGKVSILNLRGVDPSLQEVVVALVARKLFEARRAGRIPPFLFVVEEAHRFAPEKGLSTAVSSEVLRTLASEGRKFGMGLAVVSQRPAKVDKNVLSQCGTQIVLKVTNPHDLKAILSSVEGLSADLEEEIQTLPVGVALVSHPTLALPVLVEVRPRETSHGGRGVDVLGEEEGPEEPPPPEVPEERAPRFPVSPAPRRPSPSPLLEEARVALEALEKDGLRSWTRSQIKLLQRELEGLERRLEEIPGREPEELRRRTRSLLERIGERSLWRGILGRGGR